MSALNLLKPSLFETSQIVWLAVIAFIVVVLVAGNVLLWYYYHKAGERKLCTRQLQQRREELLQHLAELKTGGAIPATPEEEEREEAELEEETAEERAEDDEDGDGKQSAETASSDDGEDGDEELTTEILPVTAMSDEMRTRFGLTAEEDKDRKFFVRYSYSFEARLRNASPEVQARYVEFADEIGLYKGVKIKNSYKQQRVYRGKKTLALILFRGKTLCVAFALNPSDYVETKYRGLDKSSKKRFEKTPMLYKVSSTRRLEYAKYLLVQVADANTITMNEEPQKGEYNLEPIGRDEMYASGLMRINIVREALDEAEQEAALAEEQEAVSAEGTNEEPAVEAVEEAPAEPAEEAPAETAEEPEEKPAKKRTSSKGRKKPAEEAVTADEERAEEPAEDVGKEAPSEEAKEAPAEPAVEAPAEEEPEKPAEE